MSMSIGDGGATYTTSSAGINLSSNLSGPKIHGLNFTGSLPNTGDYFIAYHASTANAGGNVCYRRSVIALTHFTNASFGLFNPTTINQPGGSGSWRDKAALAVLSATTGALPASIATSDLNIQSVVQLRAVFRVT